MYNDDFYYDSDDGMSIERISESEQNEFNDIEGIEADVDSAGQDTFDPSGEENIAPTPEGELRSTPENPLYDPETGERIPNGYTMKDWEKRKAAIARKQEQIKARIEKERADAMRDEQMKNQLSEEQAYLERQKEAEALAHEQLDGAVAGHGEDNLTEDEISVADKESLENIVSETNPFEERPIPERWQEQFSYSINEETKTITLGHYNGDNDIVAVPSVAFDEDGNAYNVVLSDENIFAGCDVDYVGISADIPEDNFSSFFHQSTGQDYQVYVQQTLHSERVGEKEQTADYNQYDAGHDEIIPKTAPETVQDFEQIIPVQTKQEIDNLHTEPTDNFHTEQIENLHTEQILEEISHEVENVQNISIENPVQTIQEHTAGEDNTQDSIRDGASFEQISDNIEPAVSTEVPYADFIASHPAESPLEETKTNTETTLESNDNKSSVFTEQGRNNIVSKQLSEHNAVDEEYGATKLEALRSFDTSKAFQVPDEYNDGFSDVSEHRNAEIKSQLNDTVLSQADSVIMANATALDSNTQGTYGAEKSSMTDMLGAQSSFNDAIGSEAGITKEVVNHSKEEQVLKVHSVEEAVKNEQTNYKEEQAKESTARTYDDHTEKEMVKGFVDSARFNKEQMPDSDTPTKKEDLTDIQSRSSEAGAKIKIKDHQQVRDGIEAVGSMVASHILNADNSEENDVKQGINQVKTTIRDLDVLFGTSGIMASASLDAAMGIRQADLMALAKEKGVDVSKIDSFLNKQEQVQGFKDAMKSAGMNDREAKTAALKSYKEAKADIFKDLQEKGLTKTEAKALLKRGLGGTSAAQNLSSAVAAQTELLKFAEKNPSAFTDKELEFLKSDGFFNTAKHSVQISTITSKYFNKSGNQYLKEFNPAQS